MNSMFIVPKNPILKKDNYNNSKLHYINLRANGPQSILYDISAIIHSLKYADILLILGVSGCIVLPIVKIFCKSKIIVNIDGIEWKRQKWKGLAKWLLKFSEKLAVQFADATIGDNQVIVDYVNKKYGKKTNLIAYAGDHVKKTINSSSDIDNYEFIESEYSFKVCRIEAENNIEMILEAFSKLPSENLVVVGNWDYSNFGKQMRNIYDSFENLYMLDPIYNQSILDKLRIGCKMYIHGHSAGGTNPSLVEAMHLGLPILSYGIEYNIQTTENSALYFNSTDELVHLIQITSKKELNTIGSELREIAERRYKWSIISEQYSCLFKRI